MPVRQPAPASSSPAESSLVVLRDAWPWARPFSLDGWAERGGRAPLLSAALGFGGAWLLFQLAGGIATVIGIAAALIGSGEAPEALRDSEALMARFPGLTLLGNTVGQVVGFGGVAWVATRRSTRSGKAPFLRLRRPDPPGLGLAVLGWVAALPLLLWLGDLNASLPLPEWLEAFERLQTDLLDGLLLGDRVGTGWLLLALAVTPALFEELLFRGYLQRQVERRLGVATSVILVGVFFGLYHMRLSQLLPLAALGVYLGYAVWATGSLWTGSFVHLLHNSAAILGTSALLRRPASGPAALETLAVPWWLLLFSGVLTVGLAWLLRRRRDAVVEGRGDGVVVAAVPAHDARRPNYNTALQVRE
jgi:membrane protease YdiL (CAAX protease family)